MTTENIIALAFIGGSAVAGLLGHVIATWNRLSDYQSEIGSLERRVQNLEQQGRGKQ